MSVRRRSPVLLVCCCLTAYFGFHAVHGKHGIEARQRLEARLARLSGELRALDAVRRELEGEVALLDEKRPNAAYIEELARGMLAYARSDDRILLYPAGRIRSGS